MSTLKEAVKAMKLNLGCLDEAINLPSMTLTERVASELEEKVDRISIAVPPSVELKALLRKAVLATTEFTNSEKRYIPFILYEEKCDIKIFMRMLNLLDYSNERVVWRLFFVYLTQFDNSQKTTILVRLLQNIFQKNGLNYHNKKLRSVYRYQTMFWGNNCMERLSQLFNLQQIEPFLEKLKFPKELRNCKFLLEALRLFFQSNKVPLQRKFVFLFDIRKYDNQFSSIFPAVADALIPLVDQCEDNTARQKYKETCLDAFYSMLGDPRFGAQRIKWDGVSDSSRIIFLRWIAEDDMDLFFKIIEDTAVDRMWSYRLKFWKAYLPYISKTWVFFGSQALRVVRKIGHERLGYGKLTRGCFPNQSAFAFQIGNFIFFEWSHNGKLRVWDANDAPELFGIKTLEKNKVMDYWPLDEWVHASPSTNSWQWRVSRWIYENCGIEKQSSDWGM